MTLYEKIKNFSIEEMAEYLATLKIGSVLSLMFNVQDKDFIKNLNEYQTHLNHLKELLAKEEEG